jgi:hypothetical protein
MVFPPSTLVVEFTGNPVSEQDRKRLALEAAEFVRDNYSGYARLQVVEVSFDSVTNAGPLTVASAKIVYRFARRDLGEPSSPGPKP